MSVQTIKSPSGETLVVLDQIEYERLLDASDIVAAARVRHAIDNGEDELVPAEMVTRLLDGANPIRTWRQHRGLSAAKLAERAGISGAYLSELESGKKDGSLSVLKKIAAILETDLDDLV